MIPIKEAAIRMFEEVKDIGDGLEVTFDENEITFYWQNLRLDVKPKDVQKALQIIVDLKAMEARFE